MSLLTDVEQNSRRLDVYVGKERVGSLERDGAKGSVFAYLPDAQPDGFASLLMPVRLESYTSKTSLIPALQQNLPEGFLRRQLTERFGKILATDDFLLLALTGSDAIGRQRIVPSGFDPDWIQTPQTNVDELMLSQSDTRFNSLLNESLRYGISGALPKVLTSNPTTLHSERWILKMGVRRCLHWL
jgi:serine/threonine-protein kinase HipA